MKIDKTENADLVIYGSLNTDRFSYCHKNNKIHHTLKRLDSHMSSTVICNICCNLFRLNIFAIN